MTTLADFKLSDDGGRTWYPATKAEFVAAERLAGFHNTLGQPDEPATTTWADTATGRCGRRYPLTTSIEKTEGDQQ